MLRYFFIAVIAISFWGCIEKYDFTVANESEGVVIEAFISNQSYNNTRAYPSDGRYFSVKLTQTSDVTNVKGANISGAAVVLSDDQGNSWTYEEDTQAPGEYYLYNPDFAATDGRKYQLRITTPAGNQFESNWETLPASTTTVGPVSIKETSFEKYVWRAVDEKVLTTFEGIDVSIQVPEQEKSEPIYYRWSYDPLWLYIAPEANLGSTARTCWIRTPYYLKHFTLEKATFGGYDKAQFFIQTKDNPRVYEYFSVLITQAVVSEGYYYFWKDLLAQSDKGGLYDQPPFNLTTNFTAVNNDHTVHGYFGVVTENATRWVFDPQQLSYGIHDNIAELCLIDYGPPAPGEKDVCENCLAYAQGTPFNQPPWWW